MKKLGLSGRVIGGVVLLAVGIILLLSAFDVVDVNLWQLIPSLFILLALYSLAKNRFEKPWPTIVFILIFAALQTVILFDLGFSIWMMLAAIIVILIGGGLLFRRSGSKSAKDAAVPGGQGSGGHATIAGEESSVSTEPVVEIDATTASVERTVVSNDFQGGRVSVSLGQVELDLRGCQIINTPATLEVSAALGGVHIRVPGNWNVELDVNATAAEAADNRSQAVTRSASTDLIVRGSAQLASVQIND